MAKSFIGWLRQIIRSAFSLNIQLDDDLFSIDSNKVHEDSIHSNKPSLLLDAFNNEDIYEIFQKLNILEKLNKLGFDNILLEIDLINYLDQRICIYNDTKDRNHLLIEIRLTKGDSYRGIIHNINKKDYKLLLIEWLIMQNPNLSLWNKKRILPGQDYPGLPLGYALIDFFQIIANVLDLDGILCFPEFFHNAYFYSKYFYFIDPIKQAEFLSILRDFSIIDIDKISNMIENGQVYDESDEIYEWFSKEQIMPVNTGLYSYFLSDKYIEIVQKSMKNKRFKIVEIQNEHQK